MILAWGAPDVTLLSAEAATVEAARRWNAPPKVRFATDSALEGARFELVWGFSCQAVVLGCAEVFCSERERPFFVPSPAIRFAERAEGVKGPKR